MFTHDDLVAGFAKIELTPERVVMVHSSYKSLGGVDGGAEAVVDALREVVGPSGTLLFPNFTFESWTASHYFDIVETPSAMGIVGECARARPDARRTPHPMYSFAALGERKQDFVNCDDIEAYGEDSVFALFHELNGTIVSIGLPWNSTFSMHHYIEYRIGCDYRRVKRFSGIYVGYDREARLKTYSMCVRRDFRVITDIAPGMDELFERGIIRATPVGDATVHYASARDFFDNMAEVVENRPEKLHRLESPAF